MSNLQTVPEKHLPVSVHARWLLVVSFIFILCFPANHLASFLQIVGVLVVVWNVEPLKKWVEGIRWWRRSRRWLRKCHLWPKVKNRPFRAIPSSTIMGHLVVWKDSPEGRIQRDNALLKKDFKDLSVNVHEKLENVMVAVESSNIISRAKAKRSAIWLIAGLVADFFPGYLSAFSSAFLSACASLWTWVATTVGSW